MTTLEEMRQELREKYERLKRGENKFKELKEEGLAPGKTFEELKADGFFWRLEPGYDIPLRM